MSNCNGTSLREEEAINQRAIEIARKFRLPLLATNGVRYATTPEREILDVFTCIRNHRTLETAGRLLARNAEPALKTPQEMDADFFRSSRSDRQHGGTFVPACNSRCRIWDTSFRAIRCPTAKR